MMTIVWTGVGRTTWERGEGGQKDLAGSGFLLPFLFFSLFRLFHLFSSLLPACRFEIPHTQISCFHFSSFFLNPVSITALSETGIFDKSKADALAFLMGKYVSSVLVLLLLLLIDFMTTV